MAVVKLIGAWPSAYCYRVIWALKLKGIPYEYIEEDLSNKSHLLLQYNPIHKKVPVLLHDGKPICESTVILRYIDEIWPQNPLLPADPYERAVALFWIKFADDKCPLISKLSRTDGEEQQAVAKECFEMLEVVEGHALIEGKKFFGGDEINMVDIAFCSVAHWLGVIEDFTGLKIFEPHKFPRLNSWIQNFKLVPVIKDNLPDTDKMSAFLKRRREIPFAYRVIWALKLKGIPYEYIEEDLRNKSPLLLQYNPIHKKIPVLVHDGKPICECTIILQYIDEIWPQNPLLPADPYDRSVALFWIKFADDKVFLLSKLYQTDGEEQQAAVKEWLEMLEVMEEHALIGGKKFFGGDEINMVDMAFSFVAHWLGILEDVVGLEIFEPHKFPRVSSWIQNFKSIPIIKENLPDVDKMYAFSKHGREMMLASKSN
ncbi:putative glutathione S-transferase [Gossypium australe]|uniref:glutathione transferase n=1 Tax=Gossypium australe TaxID=47621 RepID=A0A5B6WU99_9ROSI|nr:putative glutathione S-transferase [Gossypium australe]